MKPRLRLAVLPAIVFAAGCVTMHPDVTAYDLGAPGSPPQPAPGKALVVFLRPMPVHWKPWAFGMEKIKYFPPSVYRVNGDGQDLIGFVDEGNKVAAQSPPGRQLFMIDSTENVDFLEATLDAGKTYYVMVQPRMGVVVARWSLLAVRSVTAKSEFFAKTLHDDTAWMQVTPKGREWYDNNRARLTDKQRGYKAKWDSRGENAAKTLNPDDGV